MSFESTIRALEESFDDAVSEKKYVLRKHKDARLVVFDYSGMPWFEIWWGNMHEHRSRPGSFTEEGAWACAAGLIELQEQDYTGHEGG